MSKYAVMLFSIFLAVTIGGANAAGDRTEAYQSLLTKRVSMVALLANPSNYDNKEVCVDGILHNVYEDDTLYLNREMADALIKQMASVCITTKKTCCCYRSPRRKSDAITSITNCAQFSVHSRQAASLWKT